MKTILGLVTWMLRDFGPLIAFYATYHFLGFVPALIATMVWSVADVALVKLKKQKVTAFLKFSIAVSLGFGLVDLYFKGPFLFRYESVLSNVVTGAFFGLTLRGEKSIIQEFAERRAEATGKPVPVNPDTIYYFRLCSMVWTGYFFLKAAFYAWVAWRYDLERALAIRLTVGNVTFYTLLGASIFLARPIILLLRRTGLAPSARGEPPPSPTTG
jgi:intracellular septation protein A